MSNHRLGSALRVQDMAIQPRRGRKATGVGFSPVGCRRAWDGHSKNAQAVVTAASWISPFHQGPAGEAALRDCHEGRLALRDCVFDSISSSIEHIRSRRNQLGGVSANALQIAPAPPEVDADVATLAPTETLQTLPEGCNTGLCRRIVGGRVQERADAPHAFTFLRVRRHRARYRRTAEQRDELAARFHSITSSARPSSNAGTARPIAFVVPTLITSSNFVGNSAGSSAGLAPRCTLATRAA